MNAAAFRVDVVVISGERDGLDSRREFDLREADGFSLLTVIQNGGKQYRSSQTITQDSRPESVDQCACLYLVLKLDERDVVENVHGVMLRMRVPLVHA